MRKYLSCLILGISLALSACAGQSAPDTRGLSFQQADADHDNRLTYGEYQNYLDARVSESDEAALKINSYEQKNRPKTVLVDFQKKDASRDTFVTRDELGITPQ